MVDVTFDAGKTGLGIAKRVDVLAIPGAEFVFRGNLSFLDLRTGRMSIANSSDTETMDVAFNPTRFDVSQDLHPGSLVKVTARFDGILYVCIGYFGGINPFDRASQFLPDHGSGTALKRVATHVSVDNYRFGFENFS